MKVIKLTNFFKAFIYYMKSLFKRGNSKAILEFDLTEETDDFYLACNGWKYRGVCWDMNQRFRELLKHNPENLDDKQLDMVESLWDEFRELLADENIDIYNDVS